jgi:hypothetical protein
MARRPSKYRSCARTRLEARLATWRAQVATVLVQHKRDDVSAGIAFERDLRVYGA